MQDLIDMAEGFIAHGADLPDPTGRFDKWIHRSALQKAIRRGQTERALFHASELHAIDPTYAFFSMAIIVVEDIGFGDIDLLSLSTATTMKGLRAKLSLSERELLACMVCMACSAFPKTRVFCELSLGAEIEQYDLMKRWEVEAGNGELIDELVADDPVRSYLASITLRKRIKSDSEPMAAIIEHMAKACTLPDDVMLASLLSFERPVDRMHNAVWPVMRRLYTVDEDLEAEPDELPDSLDIVPGLASEALDMHTSIGKRAIKAFYTSASKVYPEVREIDPTKAGKALGALVFIEEGGLVDQRAVTHQLKAWKAYQDTNFAAYYGVPMELYDDLRRILREEMPRLHNKRKWAYNNR